ncbi:hypothetical protein [Georgenia deserti]|uniref:LLM class flavin-dependent oxidoreductase n=1 Tax=Georgenia deserti TaxID=2093781 RepID=A0ABW4L4K6_9MICO
MTAQTASPRPSTVSLLPNRTATSRHAVLGLDLTALGVATDLARYSDDLPVEKADLARIASYTRAAHGNGVSFVTLGETFRLRSDRAVRRDDWLDPVTAARRIAPHGTAGIIPGVRAGADLDLVDSELAQASRAQGAWAGLHLSADDAAALTAARRPARRGPRPSVVVTVAGEDDVEIAGRCADLVRIRERDPEWARELRYAVRAAARAAGREGAVQVLADVHTVVSTDRQTAAERAALVADIAGDEVIWDGALTAYGTVEDVADVIEGWLGAGAADGFVVLPGSLPADLAALVRGVVPELRARGVLPELPAAPQPVPGRRTVDPATAPAAARRRAVAVA